MGITMFEPRTYRALIRGGRLQRFHVTVKETDLHVQAESDLSALARELVLEQRGYLEGYIRRYPEFVRAMEPWPLQGPAPEIVRRMIAAGARAGVGPMAAVAGAVAEQVGLGLLLHSGEVIVENGGDVFLRTRQAVTAAVFAGGSPLSLKVGIRVGGGDAPTAVCTSSGSVGHSISFGNADAVCVVAGCCALADAAATAIGNRVRSKADITRGIEAGKRIEGLRGILVVAADRLGAWGEIEVVPLGRKKG
jgi:ApbE superfamily uncharacterized protein (UPF0280 family)